MVLYHVDSKSQPRRAVIDEKELGMLEKGFGMGFSLVLSQSEADRIIKTKLGLEFKK